ncbi:carboxypeptidase regulatory-like domain-containing protein [Micromonospora sp. LOL_023]|uniref:carboxypeptidase regulatory-like domain-containing protein n=1 Tax=Micromonospora sp. LOL_023 TaxID=3345418 RepID=UPI003A8C7791
MAAVALVTLPVAPAQAAAPQVTIRSLSNGTLNSGEAATLEFEVTNTNTGEDAQTTFNIRVTTNIGELRCEGSCDFTDTIDAEDGKKQFSVRLVAGQVATNQTRSGRVEIRAEVAGESGTAQRDISIRGPQEAPRVKEVAGKVTDVSTGEPIEGAVVAMSDSQNNAYDTTTNANGNYRFTSSNNRPIAPGEILVGAVADGYDGSDPKRVTAAAGQSITVDRITLKSNVAPTPSPTPTPEASAEASVEPTPSAPATSTPAVETQNLASESSGNGMGSWLLIIMGGLLVALGVGAIVLLLVRRRDNAEDEADPSDDDPGGGRASVPGSQGVYHGADDATRVAMPTMPDGPVSDATMITPRPSLSDAPTMLHNMAPIKDEFADPYGALPQAPSPPGGGDQRYGGEQRPGWGGPPSQPMYGGAGAADATSVYGAVPGPDAPGPASGGGYGGATGSARPGEYGNTSPYGNAPASGGPYGNAPSSGAAGPYGNAPSSGAAGPYGNAPASGGPYGSSSAPGQYGAPAGRPAADDPGDYRGGRGYGGDSGTAGYAGGGYGSDRYDEPTGRYEPESYGRTTGSAFDSGAYGGHDSGRVDPPAPPRGPEPPQAGYRGGAPAGGYGGQESGGYGNAGFGGSPADSYGDSRAPAGGSYPDSGYGGDRGAEYGSDPGYRGGYPGGAGGYGPPAGAGYDEAGGGYPSAAGGGYPSAAGGGYPDPAAGGGYPSAAGGGYDDRRVPDQRGGYGQPAYGQQPYDQQPYNQQPYGEQPPGDSSRHGGPATPPAGRGGERRSLDWLDD